jgi:nicotinamide mononucleotide transporter
MDAIYAFFDVSNTFFTFLNYPVSYLEFVGTILNLVCVILVARRNILTWPIGIAGVILFGILFYQINLYADFFEQIYYFITGIIGWYMWSSSRRNNGDSKVDVSTNSLTNNMWWICGIVLASALASWVLINIHRWLPTLFTSPASLPVIDATTTVMSFAAQYLMMKRKIENWLLWIVIDVIAIWLYWYKEVPFVSLLYAIFLINALYGLYAWNKVRRTPLTYDTVTISEVVA